jgi:HTH-type transcriptional regulator / antitoxin HipB
VIQNQHQYKVTNSKLKELEKSLAELANNPRDLSERLLQAEKAGLQIWIDRLKAEVDEYDRLRQGESEFKFSSLPELPIALIKARIAKGMTQKQLAEKIGVREQQIQRYESSHYGSASFDRVTEISEALEISLSEVVMGVTRGSNSWIYPVLPTISAAKDDNSISNFCNTSVSEYQSILSHSDYQLDPAMAAKYLANYN